MTFRSFPRIALAAALATLSCAKDSYVHLYKSAPLADGYTEEDVASLNKLGPTMVKEGDTFKGVNFGVYSEKATRVDLLLFDDPESIRPTREFTMTRFGDVWNVYVEGVGIGQYYGYRAWGPNWPYDDRWYPGSVYGFITDVDADGNRFDPNKLLLDPYAKAVHRDHDWSKGSIATGPKRTECTYAASAKNVVVESKYKWSDSEAQWQQSRQDPNFANHRFQDLVMYEVHVKGFTASPASGVEHPGTYRGMGEKADYFKSLGINAVELLPVMEKPLDGGYWGYQTLNFFAPEISYAWKQRPGEPIDEFKWMVDQLHQRGVEVVLDVVYNHTGEGGLWRQKLELDGGSFGADLVNFDPKEVAGLYSYRGLDNQAYYALNADKQTYWNNTGVGNELRANHKPMRRLIVDSLRYWVEEMHVDGFRFDLAPILGEKDLDFNNWDDPKNTVLQDIADDPVLQAHNIRIIAEPWSAGGYYQAMTSFPAASASTNKPGYGWGEWTGAFRDFWRSFVNDVKNNGPVYYPLNGTVNGQSDWNMRNKASDFGFVMTGCYDWYHWNGRRPYHSTNFVTVHDGFTMYDLFSYDQKQNKCGPLNPVCCDQPLSAFCDRDSGESNNRSKNWGQDKEGFKRQQMRNLFMGMLLAHGTPLILGGDEWMRTQLGNNNAYTTRADNEFNWYDWGSWEPAPERVRMHDFVAKAIQLRADHRYALAPEDYGKGAPFSWKSPQNTDAINWAGKAVMMHYYDKTKGPELLVLVNMEGGSTDFLLPDGRQWKRLVDTQEYFEGNEWMQKTGTPANVSPNITLDRPDPIPVGGACDQKSDGKAHYCAGHHSIVVLEAK